MLCWLLNSFLMNIKTVARIFCVMIVSIRVLHDFIGCITNVAYVVPTTLELSKVEEWDGHCINPSAKSCQDFWQFQSVGTLPGLLTK
jgi:hypothetical protein